MDDNIIWYPVSDEVLMEGAVRGAHLRSYQGVGKLDTSICINCGGLTLDYIKENPKQDYNRGSIVCICDYGKVKENEISKRNMAIYLAYFVGELRKKKKEKSLSFLPKIDNKKRDNNINFGSKRSAFHSYNVNSHKKIANSIEKKMINILIGKNNQ